ncbi:hypothetical protein CY34DRAFT_108662 [Suillus luteus UH-Slu-Lm8-n1]|uniref:SAP domain-containing protein n=1 Tax=Suillus luteus UH-Slu-Lm8-n1 TaxID=930992 RepID=A0A0C9ZLR8_9AGAM|nr:hypothetical protein CY34DRAFT_108662 [Suillus luteus UH-Slu-Lm8-n1]
MTKPFLSEGRAAAINTRPSPHDIDTSSFYFCQCRQCVQEDQGTVSDFAEFHDVKPGCWQNASMYYRHKREETLLRELDRANLGPLKFVGHPTIDGPYVRLDPDDLLAVNSGPQALEPRHPMNQPLLALQNNLTMSMKDALGIETRGVGEIVKEKDALIQRIVRELDRADDLKEKEWERQRKGDNDEDSETFVNTDPYFNAPHASWHPMLLSDIPRDPRTVIGSFELEPRTRSYVCCTTCFALYDTAPLPLFCTHQPTPTSRPCHTKLWKTRIIRGNQIQHPIRTYLHQDLKQWMGRFLSRPGIEDLIDSAAQHHEAEDMEDIWHASTFRQFLGPDDDLLPFWDSGVTFSRTSKYPDGRVVRIALIPIICDLPAAKQVAGFSGVGSKFFCSYCLLPLYDIDNLDRCQWPPRDVEIHRRHACSYRDAPTLEERQRIFDQFGVRWTELLRLPYWDPISFTVVESMHILYLRILRYHCRVAWRMNVDVEDGETPSGEGIKSIVRPSDESMLKGVGALATGTFAALDACSKPILYHLCEDRNLRRASTKRALIKTLLNWKADLSTGNPPSKPVIPPRSSGRTSLTDAESARLLIEGTATISDLSLLRFTKAILGSLCDAKHVRRSGNKKDLVGRLLDWRLSQNLPCTRTAPASVSSTGKDVRINQSKAEEYISSSSRVDADTLMSYARTVLVALCSERHLNIVGKKNVLAQRLIRWRAEHDQDNTNDHEAPANFGDSHDSHSAESPGGAGDMNDDQLHRVVLGQTLVTEIQKDMLRTELPTWVSRAPKALGSTAQGKLSADQWRAACTINMTITLIRLWGRKKGKVKAMLDNYMDLVTAVELGCHISQYNFYMQRYLENLKDLYKTLRLVPSHHISLHLGEFLCSFGPVHAWRAFAFERYNYLLQRENSNGKFANVRTLLQEEHIRTVVVDMVDAYSSFAGEDRRGTRIRDVLQWDKTVTAHGQIRPASKEVILEERLYSALLQLIGTTEPLKYVGEGDPHNNMIEETFLAIQPLTALSDTDVPHDPYRQYPVAGGFLCYNEYHTDYHIIRPSGVICHYAKTPMRIPRIRQPCVHVLPLDRLMKSADLPSLGAHNEQDTDTPEVSQ